MSNPPTENLREQLLKTVKAIRLEHGFSEEDLVDALIGRFSKRMLELVNTESFEVHVGGNKFYRTADLEAAIKSELGGEDV